MSFLAWADAGHGAAELPKELADKAAAAGESVGAVLLTAGFGANQLAAFSGPFGAALGYLFGKGNVRAGSPPRPPAS